MHRITVTHYSQGSSGSTVCDGDESAAGDDDDGKSDDLVCDQSHIFTKSLAHWWDRTWEMTALLQWIGSLPVCVAFWKRSTETQRTMFSRIQTHTLAMRSS